MSDPNMSEAMRDPDYQDPSDPLPCAEEHGIWYDGQGQAICGSPKLHAAEEAAWRALSVSAIRVNETLAQLGRAVAEMMRQVMAKVER